MENIKINIWNITGYRGRNDYDRPSDNNFNKQIAVDARFSEKDVLNMLFEKFKDKYRCIVLQAKLIETRTICFNANWVEEKEYYSDEYSECNTRIVYRCSNCGNTVKYKTDKCFCGAIMESEQKDNNKMSEHKCKTLEEFAKVHCEMCGTQRCGGVYDEEMREGCDYYRKEFLGQPTLHEMLAELSKHTHHNKI